MNCFISFFYMDESYYIIGILVALIPIVSIICACMPNSLNKKFVSLGTLPGKSYAEISRVVGNENAKRITTNANGETVIIRTWTGTSPANTIHMSAYSITLLFNAQDICIGISSETSV